MLDKSLETGFFLYTGAITFSSAQELTHLMQIWMFRGSSFDTVLIEALMAYLLKGIINIVIFFFSWYIFKYLFKYEFQTFLNWDSLNARLNSHYETRSYKKKKHKKITEY